MHFQWIKLAVLSTLLGTQTTLALPCSDGLCTRDPMVVPLAQSIGVVGSDKRDLEPVAPESEDRASSPCTNDLCARDPQGGTPLAASVGVVASEPDDKS